MIKEPLQAQMRAAYGPALAALRAGRAKTAERQLRAIQAAAPGEVNSLRLLGVALLEQDKVAPAIETLERAVAAAPDFGRRAPISRAPTGRWATGGGARANCSAWSRRRPRWISRGWRTAMCWSILRNTRTREWRIERARLTDPHRRRIEEARAALVAEDRKTAEAHLSGHSARPTRAMWPRCAAWPRSRSPPAARGDAVRLLRHALKQSAHLPLAWRGLCQATARSRAASGGRDGGSPPAENRARKTPRTGCCSARCARRLMRQPDALAAFEEAARLNPGEVRLRLSIGHLHKTLGRSRASASRPTRQCLEMDPSFGEAYWSLADLKNYVFSDAEIAAMQALLKGEGGDDERPGAPALRARARLRARSRTTRRPSTITRPAIAGAARPFPSTSRSSRTRRGACASASIAHFFAAASRRRISRSRAHLRRRVASIRLDSGRADSRQPLERRGHLRAAECPDHGARVRPRRIAAHDAYPESVRTVPPEQFAALGRRYLEETAPLRSGRPHFIDKMPNNFSHVGLIHAMLPQAIIIDVRRHPMDSCFSTYKQYFAEGQSFSYDLDDLGRYYRCYLSLMDHWDAVLPGKVLHLQYEAAGSRSRSATSAVC